MKKAKIIILGTLLMAQLASAQTQSAVPGEVISLLDEAFNRFVSDDRSHTESSLAACAEVDRHIAANASGSVVKEYLMKKNIVLLFSYTNLEYWDYKLILNARAQKKFFDSLCNLIIKSIPSGKYDNYAFAVLGYYFENIEGLRRKAESYYKSAFEAGTAYPALLSWRGWNYIWVDGKLKDENNDLAKKWLSQSMKGMPGHAKPYLAIGQLFANRGDVDSAMQYFRKAVQVDPSYKRAHIAIASMYTRMGMIDSAMALYEVAVKKLPTFSQGILDLAWCYNQKRTPEYYYKAIGLYKRCIAIDSLDALYYERMGDVYLYNLTNHDSALVCYNEAVRLNPDNVHLLGDFYYTAKKNYPEASKYYLQKAKINPQPYIYLRIGDCYEKRGENYYKEAKVYYAKSLEADSTYESGYSYLGDINNITRQYDSSIYYYKKLISINPKKKIYIVSMGFPYYNYGNKKIANAEYYEAYKLFKEGAKLGNRGCRFMYYALQNEFGYDETPPNYLSAKEWYLKAAKQWPFCDLGFRGILRLYDSKKIAMDSVDYRIWTRMNTSKYKRFSMPMLNSDSSRAFYGVFVFDYYPPGVHPSEWEAERLKTDHDVTMPIEVYESFGNLGAYAKTTGVSFTELATHAVNERLGDLTQGTILSSTELTTLAGKSGNPRSISDLDSLIARLVVIYNKKEDLAILDSLTAAYERRIELKSETSVKTNASYYYYLKAHKYWSSKRNEDAVYPAERGIELNPDYKMLRRLLCIIYLNSDKPANAYLIYDKYRNTLYVEDPETTFREMFLKDVRDNEKSYNDNPEFKKAKLYLYSAKEKLQQNLISFDDLLESKDHQLLSDGAKFFAASWNKDSILNGVRLYEKRIALKEDLTSTIKYLFALARLGDQEYNVKKLIGIKKINELLSKSDLNDLEKLLYKRRIDLINDDQFSASFSRGMDTLREAKKWNTFLYSAKKYRDIAQETSNPNKAALLFAARRAVDLYSYLYAKMPADTSKSYRDNVNLIALRCGGFSYSIMLLKDNEYALKAATLAHVADPSEEYAKSNLPLAHLLTGNFEKAKSLYLEFSGQKFSDGRYFKEIFLTDIEDLERQGIAHADFEKIKTIFKGN